MHDVKTREQIDKVQDAAREIGAKEDEARWIDRLRTIAKQKPQPEKPA